MKFSGNIREFISGKFFTLTIPPSAGVFHPCCVIYLLGVVVASCCFFGEENCNFCASLCSLSLRIQMIEAFVDKQIEEERLFPSLINRVSPETEIQFNIK
jgi:hypothetical protein